MLRRFAGRWLGLVLLASLAACGGGDDGGSGKKTVASVDGARGAASNSGTALSFSPSTASVNMQVGSSGTISVTATLNNPASYDGDVFVVVADPDQVLSGDIGVAPLSDSTFAVTAQTVATLGVGHHTGTFQVQLCRDAVCAQPYPNALTPLPYDIHVAAQALEVVAQAAPVATVHKGGSVPAEVPMNVTGAGTVWTASTAVPWLQIDGPASGAGTGIVQVRFVPGTLAVGDYSSHLSVNSTDGQKASVLMTLHVIPTAFVLDNGIPRFTAVNGTTIAAKSLAFELDSGATAPWTMRSDAAWMSASTLSGRTPASVSLRPDPRTGRLASGNHDAHLTLSSSGVASKVITSRLQLVAPVMSTSTSVITLGGARGRDIAASQSLALAMNTGYAYTWTSAAADDWLAVTSTQPTVGPSSATVHLALAPAHIVPGSDTTALTFTAHVNGDVVSKAVTVNENIDQRRLLPSTWGVGLASTPTGTVLTRTLKIKDNFAGTLAWTATSDQAWLHATASGTTGGASSLVLTADPSALANDSINIANVTVATATAGVSPATVRVGLWKSATGASGIMSLTGVDATALVADKIRPLIYANTGGTGITIYNAYTAAVVGTIANVGSALGQMTVSPDGSRLYVLDTPTRLLKVVSLNTRSVLGSWHLTKAVSMYSTVLAIRPNGVEVVLVGDGTAYVNGRALTSNITGRMSATDDGSHVYRIDYYGFAGWNVDYSEMAGGTLFESTVPFGANSAGGSNGEDIAVAGDGSALYVAFGNP
ncbi:MAG: hypothetical protein ABJD97_06610, partial [Betaproteobacteria bacterium]